MTAMSSISDETMAAATGMPRFEDGFINLQEVLRKLVESVVNEIMSAGGVAIGDGGELL